MASPVAWGVGRKGINWAPKASPGAHSLEESVPLLILIRDKLGLAENSREVKRALNAGEVLVDGRKVADPEFGVGLMDTISIPSQEKHYRALFNGKKLELLEIDAKRAGVKYCKVLDKRSIKKGFVQLNLHDGRNLLVEKEEDRFKPGDTLRITVPKQKLEGFKKFEPGARCLVYRGRHSGEIGELVEVAENAGSKSADAKLKTPKGEIITLKDYLFVVDNEFKGIEK